jgi:tripartite-type tricarboxylate transporter receptor subunit TctC
MMRAAIRLTALVVLCAMTGRPALAQGDADFFRNKTVKLMITFEPGGSYDLYARLAATHLPKHLAGQPAMTVQYHPGAGGLIGILHFARRPRRMAPSWRSCRATSRSISGCGRRPPSTMRAGSTGSARSRPIRA